MLIHDTLLLASGTVQGRHALRSVLADGYNLLEAATDRQTMLLLEHNAHCIAAVLLDISSGGVTPAVLEEMNRTPQLRFVPVVVLTPPQDPDAVGRILAMGAIEAMPADTESFVLLQRVRNIVELHRHKWHLEEMIQDQAQAMRRSSDAMVDVLSSLIEYRSAESGQHILRIRRFTEVLLREVRRSVPAYGLTDRVIGIISSAAALHDIGKISIPDAVLNKPSPLTAQEWKVMERHADTGSRIIRALGNVASEEYLRYAYHICRHHHERWDGSGYPDGLAGDDIPICAQVVGLADAYDALTSQRVYKDALSCEQSVTMICNGECGVFSPTLLECFKHVAGKFAELARAYADGASPKADHFDTELPGPDRREELNALQVLRYKYQMLLHFLDCTVVEVDMDQGAYHVVYNPDPLLDMLHAGSSLAELDRLMTAHTVSQEDRQQVAGLVEREIPAFLESGRMRLSYRIPLFDPDAGVTRQYDLTVLRQSMHDPDLHRIMVIWQPCHDTALAETASVSHLRLLVCRHDRWLTLEGSFRELCRVTGYEEAALNERFHGRLLEMLAAEDQAEALRELRTQLVRSKDIELMLRLPHCDGRRVSVLYRCRLVTDPAGRELLSGLLVDLSRQDRELEQLREQLARNRIILSQTENVLYEWDMESDRLVFSDSWEGIFGYPPVAGNLISLLQEGSHFHPEDLAVVYESIAAMRGGADYRVMEVRVAKADGRYLWCRFRSTALRDSTGKIRKIVGIIINIDEEKRSAQALQEQAERDGLTRLLNKHAAEMQAESYLSDFAGETACALLIIDLDDFKAVNDRFGHRFGDAVLTQVAREIRRLFRPQDIVGRIGGDEFLVLMRSMERRAVVEDRCRRLTDAIGGLFRDQLGEIRLGCSIGVALYPQHGRSYAELFSRADRALYWAKAQGKNVFAIYDSADSAMNRPSTAVGARIDSDDDRSPSSGNIVHYAFRMLYESTDVEATVRELLALIGRRLGVSRVYIFENGPDNRTCSNTFEWCSPGIQPQIEFLQNISYEKDVPTLLDQFDAHGLFYCPDVSELPEDLRQILEPQRVKSILVCAFRDNGVFRGYMGFDECSTNLFWTKDQIDMLTYFAETLSVFLLKKRAQDLLNP